MNRFFYDLDGSPLTGKTPVQVHVYGDGDHDTALNEAEGEIAAFLDAVRLSPAKQHRRDAPLGGGGSVRMNAVDDVITVEVFTEKRTTGGEPFYGGILLKLNVVRDEAGFREDCMKDAPEGSSLNRHDLKLPISHTKFSGENETLPGRPAVPGTTDEDQAEWIVLQIAKDKPLNADPFNSGAVKIFRIHNPKFGDVVEFGLAATYPMTTSAEQTENRYLLSALPAIDSEGNLALAEFSLCGQRVEDLPSFGTLPLGSYVLGSPDPMELTPYAAKEFSIYAVDFIPDSFERAYAAGGIVIVAAGNRLAAINTAEKTATSPAKWKILDVSARGNDFGAEFTDVVGFGGARTITCHGGVNGLGARSGYSVTITPGPNPGDLPTISGKLTPGAIVPLFTTIPGIETYTKTMSGYASSGLVSGPIPPLDTQIAYGYAGFITSMTCNSVYRAPDPVFRKNAYTGEVPPRETIETFTFTAVDRVMTMTSESNYMMGNFNAVDFGGGPTIFTLQVVPMAETEAKWKRQQVVGPMFSAKVRSSWLEETTSPLAKWVWGDLVDDYRIIRPDGSTIYYWGDIKQKFPAQAADLWGPLNSFQFVWQPNVGLPVEPMNAPAVLNGSTGAGYVGPPVPGEEFGVSFRHYPGGYPTLGLNGSWTFPPVPYFVPNTLDDFPIWYRIAEVPSSWSFTATYTPGALPRMETAASMAALFPSSGYLDGIAQRSWAEGAGDAILLADLQWSKPMAMADNILLGPIQGPYRGGMYGANSFGRPTPWMGAGPVNDWYLRDPRTGGFIAQMYWVAETPEDPLDWQSLGYSWIPRTFPTTCEIIVGNDLGTVPLAALLNEWMHLGEVSAPGIPSLPTTYNLVFIDDRAARQAMLI